MEAIIDAKKICFSYGNFPVIREASFSLNMGELVMLMGANGSGKSTLLKLILSELSSSCGSISLFGKDIRQFKDWKKIGYVAQNSMNLGENFPASVLEIVSSGLYGKTGFLRFPKREWKSSVADALELVGMGAYAKRMITHLSGGQKQCVMLAKSFVAGCELMILDEPTAGVDRETSLEIYGILKRKCENEGLTVLLVTHDDKAADFCSRVLCLEDKNLLELQKEQLELERRVRHIHYTPSKEHEHGHL